MADVPPFLGHCDRFPDCRYVGEECDSDCSIRNDSARNSERKAFELKVSVKSLLKIEGAAELLLKVLLHEYHPHGSVIWLSDDIYMSKSNYRPRYPSTYRITMLCGRPGWECVYICRQSPKAMMDTPLKLLAHCKNIQSIHVGRAWLKASANTSDDAFPASLEALQAFVSEAQSSRELSFAHELLSVDQWRVISCNCNNQVTLEISINDGVKNEGRPLDSLIEAMNLNQCPAKLKIMHLYGSAYGSKPTETNVFYKFVAALESTTSLEKLFVNDVKGRDFFFLLCGAISRNRGLRHLCFQIKHPGLNLSDAEWEIFCSAVASHPTLQTLNCSNLEIPKASISRARARARDQILIQCIVKNTVLREFYYDRGTFHNGKRAQETIGPVLEWNRFRSAVHSIKQETNVTRQQQWFASMLMSDLVCKRPSFRFFLLQENPELLAELSSPKNVLSSLWNKALARFNCELTRLEAVEERMRNAGFEPPSREPVLAGSKRKR